MSDTEPTQKSPPRKSPPRPNLEKLVKQNPGADGIQIREAQVLIKELRREGVTGPSYDIASPYERRPVRATESSTARNKLSRFATDT